MEATQRQPSGRPHSVNRHGGTTASPVKEAPQRHSSWRPHSLNRQGGTTASPVKEAPQRHSSWRPHSVNRHGGTTASPFKEAPQRHSSGRPHSVNRQGGSTASTVREAPQRHPSHNVTINNNNILYDIINTFFLHSETRRTLTFRFWSQSLARWFKHVTNRWQSDSLRGLGNSLKENFGLRMNAVNGCGGGVICAPWHI